MRKKWRPEREFDKTIKKELEKKWGEEYLSGSLYELEMIDEWITGTGDVTLYSLTDEFEPYKPKKKEENATTEGEVLVVSNDEKYERAFNAKTNQEVFINTEHRHELRASGFPFEKSDNPREFRRLKHFLAEMRKYILYSIKDETDFIRRYCFLRMKWNGRVIESIYFNKHSRRIYFQLKPQKEESYYSRRMLDGLARMT